MFVNKSNNLNEFLIRAIIGLFLLICITVSIVVAYDFRITVAGLFVIIALIIMIVPFFFIRDIFHPLTILFISTILAVIDFLNKDLSGSNLKRLAGVSNEYRTYLIAYSLSIFICWYLFLYLGYWFSRKTKDELPYRNLFPPEIKKPIGTSVILLSIVLLGFIYTLSIFGGISGMLIAVRDPMRSFSGNSYLREIVSLGGLAAMLLLAKNYKKLSTLILIITCVMLFFFGGRAAIILGVILPYMMVYYYNVKMIKTWKIAVVGILGLVFVSIMGEIRKFGEFSFSLQNIKSLINNAANATGRAETVPALIGSLLNRNIEYQFGKPLINIIYAPIPRSIWSNKPEIIDESALVGYFLLGGERYYGLPPGPYGWAFYNFGWIGVVVFGFMTGYVVQKLYKRYIKDRKNKHNELIGVMFYSLIIQATFNIFATSSQINIVWFTITFIIIYIFDILSRRVNHKYQKSCIK